MYIAIAAITALLAALWGWYKGILSVVLRLGALCLAYTLAWQGTPRFAQYLSDKGWVSGLPAWLLAAVLLFVGGSLFFSAVTRWFYAAAPEGWRRGGRKMGALSGLVLGVGVGVLLVWTVSTLRDAWHLHVSQQSGEAAPGESASLSALDQVDSVMRDLSGEAMASVTHGVLGDSPAAAVATQWVRQPLSMSEGLKHLAGKQELRLLFQQPDNYAIMSRGTAADIMQLQAFQALVADPQVMQFLKAAGLSGDTVAQQSMALAEMFSRYTQSFEKLRGSQEFQALVHDAGLQETLKQGNLLVLITNDKVRRIADMLVKGQLPELPAAQTLRQQALRAGDTQRADVQPGASTPAVVVKPLYRWRDQSGHLHITEDKPPEGIPFDVIKP